MCGITNHFVFIYHNCATNADYGAYDSRCAVRSSASRVLGNLHRVTHGVRLSSHQPRPARICAVWPKFGALSWLGGTLPISFMYEAGLGNVMSGTETAPAPLADGTAANVVYHEAVALAFKE